VASDPLRVVVVGAGFAGSATTVALVQRLRSRPLSIALVERSGSFGRGIAYSTRDPQHLLNVPVSAMSAVHGDSDHLLDWARRSGVAASRETYLPRGIYGDYLEDLLATTGDRVRRIHDEVVAVEDGAVRTRAGEQLEADAVVLAAGPSAPAAPGPTAPVADHPGYVANAWDHDAIRALGGRERVLIVGTGLTMVDAALSLTADGPGPEMLAIARHGEPPRVHLEPPSKPGDPPVRPGEHDTADALAERVEALARAAADWRFVIDSLRPVTADIWRALPPAEQAAFFDRHSRRWEVHRSRIAPQVGARMAELQAAGRLRVEAGSLDEVRPAGDRIDVRIGDRRAQVDGIVNASGPAWDCRTGSSELIKGMLAAGTVAPGPLGLGLRATRDGALIDRDGRVSDRLFTLGALLRGELWETLAVAEIREQAYAIAERIARA
jgi:uncharacterized NAD(P)/FAD-binding protein YdhS